MEQRTDEITNFDLCGAFVASLRVTLRSTLRWA